MDRNNTGSLVKIRIADWQKDKDELTGIRQQVFIEEQQVPEDMEWDEYDDTSTHFLATLKDKTIATARLKPDGQIGRMAVLTEFRNQGIGSKLLQFILQDAGRKDFKKIYLHAQLTAIPFYEKYGFTAHGEVFYEADIPHRKMQLQT
jgi:predicted GNAT family N-acyltransferase